MPASATFDVEASHVVGWGTNFERYPHQVKRYANQGIAIVWSIWRHNYYKVHKSGCLVQQQLHEQRTDTTLILRCFASSFPAAAQFTSSFCTV